MLKGKGGSDGDALQGALLFTKATDRPLDANNATFSDLPQTPGVYSSDQIDAFTSALNQKVDMGEGFATAYADTQDVAGLVPIKQRVDTLNTMLAKMDVSDSSYPALRELSSAMGYALSNEDVYFNNSVPQILPAGISRLSNAQIAQSPLSALTPSMLVDDQSGFYSAVYYDANTSNYVVADRGTDDLKDWKSNALQAIGLDAKQYDEAAAVASLVKKENISNVVFTGHSLGGGLASLQSLLTGFPAYTFNAASLSQGTLTRMGVTTDQANQASALIHYYDVNHELLGTLQDNIPFIMSSAQGDRTRLTPVSFNDANPNTEVPIPSYEDFNPATMLRQHSDTSVLHVLNYLLTQTYGTSGD